jgi:hypothetical protein
MMRIVTMMTKTIAAALVLAGAFLAPAPASAQNDAAAPSDVAAPGPSYAMPEETVSGRVVSFDGNYALQVRDDRGFVDNVQLRDGTIINPTGVRLAPGMRVTIYGVNRGSVLAANQIDTPYQSYGSPAPVAYAVPAYPYYPVYGYGYGYPYYGYPYAYGPRISVGIGFGFGGRWGGRWR